MGKMLTFDASGYDVEALKAMAALANMVKGRADMVEKGAKAALGDRLEKGGESVSVAGMTVGRIQRTKGGEGCWKVEDPAAYGAWLKKADTTISTNLIRCQPKTPSTRASSPR